MSLAPLTKAWVQYGLHFYKRWVSPMLPGACRFVPTCSEYAAEAIEHHGVLHGGALALWRLLRCQPLARGGFDPVPAPGKTSRCCSQGTHVSGLKLKTDNWQLRTGN